MYTLILAALLVTSDPAVRAVADPNDLVRELGSARFARREAAERELGRLGRRSIPALRQAIGSGDPEVRARAAALLDRIEGMLLVEPTLVDLDVADVPLVDAIATIGGRSGIKLTLAPDLPATWADRRLSLNPGAPVPFWRAMDILCAAGQIHYVFGGQAEFDHGDPSFPLYDGFAAAQGRFDDHGPFRVQLASMHYQSEIHLGTDQPMAAAAPGRPVIPARPTEVASKQFFLQLLVGAEPRLLIAPAGPVRISEAIDDEGHAILVPPPQEVIQHDSGYQGVNASPLVHLRADLIHPDRPVARLKRIRGSIPLRVSMRRSDPLTIPLDDAVGKSYQHNDVAVTIHEIHTSPAEQPATIDLSLKLVDDGRPRGADVDDDPIRMAVSPQRLEVLDAQGRAIPWFPSSSLHNGQGINLTLTLFDRTGPTRPATIRFHDLISDRTEVPFEFRDLPMP